MNNQSEEKQLLHDFEKENRRYGEENHRKKMTPYKRVQNKQDYSELLEEEEYDNDL
jgi:hypothetical protein